MKILFVQKMNGISGSELYMLQIMPELKRRGYEVEMLVIFPVATPNNDRFIAYLTAKGITSHILYGDKDYSPALYRKIIRLLKTKKYDIVHANLVHAAFYFAVLKIFYFQRIVLLGVKHGYYPEYLAKYGYDLKHLKKYPYYWIERFVSRAADFNITISMGLYNAFTKGGMASPAKTRNIYYGLTLEQPVEAGVPVKVPDPPFILMTGRLVSFKGHIYLIDAWKKVNQRFPHLKLYLAGEGEMRQTLEARVAQAGLQQVIIFLGHVPNPHPLMENCLFTVVPSTWEGFGLILLESWLHKKPIVAFDAPAMNEIIDHGKNGLLAKARDSNDLADRIIDLVEKKELIRQLGENGYEKLHGFYTLKRMTDETEEVYRSLCK